MIAFLCGGMTVGELCDARPNLRGAIREYFEFFGKGMEGGKLQTLEHKVNGKVVWILDFQDFTSGKVEITLYHDDRESDEIPPSPCSPAGVSTFHASKDDVFGDVTLLTGRPLASRAVAITRVRVLRLDPKDIERALRSRSRRDNAEMTPRSRRDRPDPVHIERALRCA